MSFYPGGFVVIGICEAAGRPTMRFVAIKSAEQQSILALHRSPQITQAN